MIGWLEVDGTSWSHQNANELRPPATTWTARPPASRHVLRGNGASVAGGLREDQEGIMRRNVEVSRRSRFAELALGFSPRPLTKPDVNLSIYTAGATARRLPPSVERGAHPGVPVGPNQRR